MDNSDHHMEDIPLLQDLVAEEKPNQKHDTINNGALDAKQPHPAAPFEPEPLTHSKENPFLPYEHLARLALEREQFTQSLEAFTENLKHEKPYRDRTPITNCITPSQKGNDAIIASITRNVLNELKPIIEDKITQELERYFDAAIEEY